ncbi:MAG: hypothetical protein H6P98_895 [Candidatus Aminicenantes bacterium]|jgi:hypothetical protein|nr:hypothetical protein [Candidatus Aminicenantes bacterium]
MKDALIFREAVSTACLALGLSHGLAGREPREALAKETRILRVGYPVSAFAILLLLRETKLIPFRPEYLVAAKKLYEDYQKIQLAKAKGRLNKQ